MAEDQKRNGYSYRPDRWLLEAEVAKKLKRHPETLSAQRRAETPRGDARAGGGSPVVPPWFKDGGRIKYSERRLTAWMQEAETYRSHSWPDVE